METSISQNVHTPEEAKFKTVPDGGFCCIDIGEHPISVCLLITGTREKNLEFLYQLAQATEQAIKYEILKEGGK